MRISYEKNTFYYYFIGRWCRLCGIWNITIGFVVGIIYGCNINKL